MIALRRQDLLKRVVTEEVLTGKAASLEFRLDLMSDIVEDLFPKVADSNTCDIF